MPEAATTERFIAALAALEQGRDLEPMSGLFAPGSVAGNVVSHREFSGMDGARAFWAMYRDSFAEVASSFRNVIAGEGRAALEWTTTGTSAAGDPIAYDGVSVLEMENGQITRFWAYFDPAHLGKQIAPHNASS